MSGIHSRPPHDQLPLSSHRCRNSITAPRRDGPRLKLLQVTTVGRDSSSAFPSPFGLLADQLSSDSTWSLPSHQSDFSSTVAPRLSPAVPAYSSSQWQNDFSSSIGEPKPWPVAPRNAMPANAQSADNPSATSGRAYAPINTGWGSRPSSPTSDSSTWDGNHNRTHTDSSRASPKPPLPVCDSYSQQCRCAGPNLPDPSTGLLQIVVALK